MNSVFYLARGDEKKTSKAARSKHSYLCIKKPAGMLNAKRTMHLAKLTLRTKFRYLAERCASFVRDLALWCHSYKYTTKFHYASP